MAGKGPGIYFNRKTREVISINGHEDRLDLKGWVKISDEPSLGLLAVRELVMEKRLAKDARDVYWSGFRRSGPGGDDGQAVGVTFLKQARRESELKSTQRRRGSGSAVQRLLRSIFGPRAASWKVSLIY